MQTESHGKVPYGTLRASPRNVRNGQPLNGIPQLAAMIAAQGISQNLLVSVHQEGRRRIHEVEAGRRRHAALDLLFTQGKITKSYPVPVKFVASSEGRYLSLGENQREQMHPVDEYLSFRDLIDEDGRSIEDVAVCFGVTPLVVKQRLRLANVAPRFLDLFRTGEIDYDELTALAITDDHQKQCDVWDSLPPYSRTVQTLRHALTESEIDAKSDVVARFVGLKAYEAAGGAVRRDLFMENHDGFLLDPALLHQLAQKKLDKRAAAIEREGWAWVETHIRLEYAERRDFGQLDYVRRELTKAEAKKLATLEKSIAPLRKLADSEDEQPSEAQLKKLGTLEAKWHDFQASLKIPDPDQLPYAGAIVTISREGKTEILRGLIRPADAKKFHRGRDDTDGAGSNEDTDDKAERGPYSDRLRRNLTAHFTAGLRTRVAQSPHVALALLVNTLVSEHIHERANRPLRLHMEIADLGSHAEDIEQSLAASELRKLQEAVTERIPGENRFQWLLAQSNDDLLYLLALYLAPAIDAVSSASRGVSAEALELARAAQLNMADYWKATGDSYLRHIPKALIVESVRDAVSPEAAALVSNAKTKALMVATAESHLKATNWVPAILST